MELVAENVVVTANKFNPSILNQVWLEKKGFIGESDLLQGCIFTPVIVQVQTPRFAIFAIDDRLQFGFQPGAENKQEIVENVFGGIVRELPETPYTALGLNFIWNFLPAEDAAAMGRRLFPNPTSPIFQAFNHDGARFGGYFSKDALGFRLKLNAMPIQESPREEGAPVRDLFQFQFNFHADAKSHADIQPLLKEWSNAKLLTTDLTKSIEGLS